MRALVVEDEKIINDNIKKAFEKNKFAVDQAFNGRDGIAKSHINTYDIIIIDINMPLNTGFDLLRELRVSEIKTPAIFLSARDSIKDIEEAFKMGIDDYLIKPFDLNVLVMKTLAIIKRLNDKSNNVIKCGELEINLHDKTVTKNHKEVELTAKQYAILEYLAINKGKFVKSEDLISHVWNEDVDEFSNSIRTHIANLRRKVETIESKTGFGYRLP